MENLPVNKIELEPIQLAVRKWIDQDQFRLSKPEVTVDFNPVAQALYASMRGYIFGLDSHKIVVDESYPEDWWQAFRERWLPRFWLRRWPVRYRHIRVNEKRYEKVCPHMAIDPREAHFHWFAGYPWEPPERR